MNEAVSYRVPHLHVRMLLLRLRIVSCLTLPTFGEVEDDADRQEDLRLAEAKETPSQSPRSDHSPFPSLHQRAKSEPFWPSNHKGRRVVSDSCTRNCKSPANNSLTLRQKKSLNVDSPSFTPTILARNNVISQQAASAAPFTPRGLNSRKSLLSQSALATLSRVLTFRLRCWNSKQTATGI